MRVPLNQQTVKPLTIFLLALILAYCLSFLKSTPEISTVNTQAQRLTVSHIEPATHAVKITGRGTVQPQHRYQIIAQVSGNIIQQADQLEIGSHLQKGELLCQLDPMEYQYQFDQASALAAHAAFELKTITNQPATSNHSATLDNTLLSEKKAQLRAAEDAKALAQLNLQRTRITAPCEGVVLSETIAEGQVVTEGSRVAEFACTDNYQVVVLVPQQAIAYLGDLSKPEQVAVSVAGMSAKIIRVLPELVDNTALAKVLLSITDPLKQNQNLYFDQLVDAEIQGQPIENSYLIPEHALQPDNFIWVIKDQKQLAMTPVKLINYQDNKALIALQDTQIKGTLQVVTSPLSTEIYDGMLVDAKETLSN